MERNKDIWRDYFDILHDGSFTQDLMDFIIQCDDVNCNLYAELKNLK